MSKSKTQKMLETTKEKTCDWFGYASEEDKVPMSKKGIEKKAVPKENRTPKVQPKFSGGKKG